MKTILVPVDFSECSANAAKVACSLAKKTGASIKLIHVYERPYYGVAAEYFDMQADVKLADWIAIQMAEFKGAYFEGVEVNEFVFPDRAIWNLFDDEALNDIALVVIGTHGASGAREVFIGSNTEKVVRKSPVPVLAIHEGVDEFAPKDIVFASNFYQENKYAFQKLVKFAKFFDATIHLLRVNSPNSFESTSNARKLMQDYADEFKLEKYTINLYSEYFLETGIHEFAKEVNAGLIAIGTHGRNWLGHLMYGSMAEDVVNHETFPIMTIKIEDVPDKERTTFKKSIVTKNENISIDKN